MKKSLILLTSLLLCLTTLQANIKSTNIQGYFCFNKKDGNSIYQVYKKYPIVLEKNIKLELVIDDKNLIIENLKAKEKKTKKKIIKNSIVAFISGFITFFIIDTVKNNN